MSDLTLFSLLRRKPDECGCFAKAWKTYSPAKAACALDEAAAWLVCQHVVRFDACCDWSPDRCTDVPARFP